MPIFPRYLLLGLFAFLSIKPARCACPIFSGDLDGLEHEIAGSVSAGDCKLTATDFSYDGFAPQVYWWAAPTCDPAVLKKSGVRISSEQLVDKFSGGELTVTLFPDVDWSNVKCISVYCEEFFADLGHVELSAGPQAIEEPPASESPDVENKSPSLEPVPEPSPKPVSSPSPAPAKPASPPAVSPPSSPSPPRLPSIQSLPNCMELIPGYFNVYWSVDDNSTLSMGLEGRPGDGNRWMAFGYSPAGATGPEMVGSDVVVVGMVGTECFALNYHLSDQAQCDFSSGLGACPDYAGTTPFVPTTSAKLVACNKVGDTLSVLLTRPLGPTDNKDNAWPTDGSRFSVFAMGPISEGSNATVPVILYHRLTLPGTNEIISVNAGQYQPIRLDLGASSGNICRKIVANAAGAAPAPGPSTSIVAVATLDGPTEFKVTIGSNKNYPNPPAWGYSLWVNGNESPVLVVRRGTTYTWVVESGPTHPVYITDSIIGGGSLVDYQGERVLAGNSSTFGTADKPAYFTWTPDEDTLDVVFYQCTVHQKLGWKIQVLDAGEALPQTPGAAPNAPVNAAPPPASPPSAGAGRGTAVAAAFVSIAFWVAIF